jgi:TRAP-type C4-dicarboxylate transport system permease small subunit
VRRSGSRIRITAQLIRAIDSSHVWSQSFDRDLSDIFAVQDEIAAAVAGELAIKLLGGPAPKARPTDPRAYSLYLEGRHFFSLYSATGYERAIPAIEGALAIDPGFAPAWGMLGALYWGQANNSLIPYAEGARKARLASEKALALDPGQAEPMSLLGFLDVIELSMAAFAFLGAAYCQRLGGHIRMDLAVAQLRGRWLWAAEALATLVALVVFALLIKGTFDHFLRAWTIGDTTIDAELKTWPSKLLAPVGLSFLWLRLLLNLFGYLRLVRHPDAVQVAVPPPPGAGHGAPAE